VQEADETEAWRYFVGRMQISCAKLQTEKVTNSSCYEHREACSTIEHADNFIVNLPVYAEDGWTAGLLVVSDRTAVWRPSRFANEPVATYEIVGNEVFVDCSSKLDRQS
jgi:hypothetical protein